MKNKTLKSFLKTNKIFFNYDKSEAFVGVSKPKLKVKNINLNRYQYVYDKTLFLYFEHNKIKVVYMDSVKKEIINLFYGKMNNKNLKSFLSNCLDFI